jgi:outer membrane protein assembly factor BamE
MIMLIIHQLTLMRLVLITALLFGLGGCVYRLNIQQGNFLEAKAVDQLQVGMTRSQTRYLLGTPMVPNAFDQNRWDYVYYFKKGRWRAPEQRHVVVYFTDDKVLRIEREGVIAAAPPAPAADAAPADPPPAVDTTLPGPPL